MNGVTGERRVLVTGVGLVTPLGPDRESSWRRLLAGDVAVQRLVADRDGRLIEGPGEWSGAPARVDGGTASEEPVVDLALRAAREAADDGRLSELDPERVGCVVGTSKGGLLTARRLLRDGAGDWTLVPPNAPAVAVAGEFGLGGPLLCPVLACATGLAAIVRGAELVRDGTCDAVLAGSSDASLLDVVVGSFRRLGVHSRTGTCRPFDAERDGFVVGEGAGMLLLEAADSAKRRGVTAYAEWLGGRTLGDPTGVTTVDLEGGVLARAVTDTLAAARVEAAGVDLAQLHGTGTVPNDLCETAALRRVVDAVPCCAVKGAIGHLLGAAGSVETAFTALALRDQVVPPTPNHTTPDPACDLPFSTTARPASIQHALKTSLGFGGHVAVGLLRRVDG